MGRTYPLFVFRRRVLNIGRVDNMGTKYLDVSAILVAGGKSRRLGQDKRFIEIGGQALFDRSLATLESLFSEVIVVVAEKSQYLNVRNALLVSDLIRDRGSLGGLYTGLSYATHPRAFAIACDMPFLNSSIVRYLVELDSQADVVMPKLATGLQPLHAVYATSCVPVLEQMARTNRLKIHELVMNSTLAVHLVPEADLVQFDPDLRSFHNINSPEDLERARTVQP